jgi:microcompartment protein CcmL/EutN
MLGGEGLVASQVKPAYRKGVAEANKVDFESSAHILEEEDEATLAILKKRIKSSDEARSVPAEEVHQRMKT